MARASAPSLARVVSFVSLVTMGAALAAPLGCQEKKSAVEKRAEEMAKANASTSASASASAAPDPGEQKYASAVKAAHDRALTFMGAYLAVQKSSGGKPDVDKFRAYFRPGPEGDKEHQKVAEEAAFWGKQNVPIVEFEVASQDCDAKVTQCTMSMWEKQSQRGKFVCNTYKLVFTAVGDALYWKEKGMPTRVECEPK